MRGCRHGGPQRLGAEHDRWWASSGRDHDVSQQNGCGSVPERGTAAIAPHDATAIGTDGEVSSGERRSRGAMSAAPVGSVVGWRASSSCDTGRACAAMAIGEEAVVADAMEAVRQDVQQEAADELVGVERHHLGLAVVAVILPAEARPARRRARPAGCWRWRRDGCSGRDRPAPARVRRRAAWRRPPIRGGCESREAACEGLRLGKAGEIRRRSRSLPASKALCSSCRNSRRNSRESTRTGRKKPGRQAIQRVPSRRHRRRARGNGRADDAAGSGPRCAARR